MLDPVGLRISISVCESNRSDRPPKVVCVLGFEEGDRSVGQAYIEECKEACAMLEIEITLQRGSLCVSFQKSWMLPFQNWPI